MTLEDILAGRPTAGQPRSYSFPGFERHVLRSGLQVLTVHVPGRPLVSANLVIRRGAAQEPANLAGASVLAARAMTEGTAKYPGLALVEAAERLGSTLHVETGWDAFGASMEVAASRLRAALELIDEVVERPLFPEEEVARLRDERLNDLMQMRAEPRRRVEYAFTQTIYTPQSPYSRLAGGDEATVRGLGRPQLLDVHRSFLDPSVGALVVGGDLTGLDVPKMAAEIFGSLAASGGPGARTPATAPVAQSAVGRPVVRLYHRPHSVQSEIRIGHVGLPRRVPDFHAVQVMGAILGGLFNSRLQRNLREDKGYTYGIGAGFDMRRAAGPFAVRTAVQTAVTAASIGEVMKELRRMRETDVTEQELATARDYLIGVFPLRFEVPSAVVGAVAGLFANELPDDELSVYREKVDQVTVADVRRVAEEHLHAERVAIVLVGDADAIAADVEKASFGEFQVIREELPAELAEDAEGAAE